jgi:protein-tyrosine-phosphatase
MLKMMRNCHFLFAIMSGMNIHFICRGNVFRSLVAETYLKSLKLDGINVISSGTNVNWDDAKEREYFSNTLRLLKRHGIIDYAKNKPDQLDQARIDQFSDVTVLMNERVVNEANKIIQLPEDVHNWMIVDIGEGHRTNEDEREQYEEDIYQEIIQKVDELLSVR